MVSENRHDHWEAVYANKGEDEVSWFEESPNISLQLIEQLATPLSSSIVDVGGGASRLVDCLIYRGFRDLTVLDLSKAALQTTRTRLGNRGVQVNWIQADVTVWQPERVYDIWHDRAAFHFLTDEADCAAYVARLASNVKSGGHAIIATCALNGPEKCSGLPVVRYSPETLGETLGPAFQLIEKREHAHSTPWKSEQTFQMSIFRHR